MRRSLKTAALIGALAVFAVALLESPAQACHKKKKCKGAHGGMVTVAGQTGTVHSGAYVADTGYAGGMSSASYAATAQSGQSHMQSPGYVGQSHALEGYNTQQSYAQSGYGMQGYNQPGYGMQGYGGQGYAQQGSGGFAQGFGQGVVGGATGYGAPGYGAPGYGAPNYGAQGGFTQGVGQGIGNLMGRGLMGRGR